jgi:hypothetical protein
VPSGSSGAVSTAIRVVGIVVGLVILFWSAHLRRSIRKIGSGSMFSSPSYRRIVVTEVVALFGGAALLGATGRHEYVIAWFATVVGVHFLAFDRLFFAGFYWLGTALIAAGIAGTVVGLAGGGLGTVEMTTGLIAAASLFAAAGSTVASARASQSRLNKGATRGRPEPTQRAHPEVPQGGAPGRRSGAPRRTPFWHIQSNSELESDCRQPESARTYWR